MSKPISISFGKPKIKPSTSTTSGAATTPILPPKRPDFKTDPEDDAEDERLPAHESVLGFASDGGAILSRPIQATKERVIENQGNADWRTRGRPAKEKPPQQHGGADPEAGTEVEKEEASKKAGLQFADRSTTTVTTTAATNGKCIQDGAFNSRQQQDILQQKRTSPTQTADEAALSALLHQSHPSSTTIIQQAQGQAFATTTASGSGDETLDFRSDVASRPDPATLDEYAAMPVEEFGMALLRGMGKKRRANGEVIVIENPNEPDADDKDKKRDKMKKSRDPNAGYLGIGAKPVKLANGSAGGEDGLGAWGKADMRRNKKGEGLYTPVMLRDRRTGELISETDLEERRKLAKDKARAAAKTDGTDEQDWRDRRDRNLGRNGIGRGTARHDDHDYRDKVNASSSSPRKPIEHSTRDAPSRQALSSPRRRSRSRSRSRSSDRDRDRRRDHDDRRSGKYRDRDLPVDRNHERFRDRRARR